MCFSPTFSATFAIIGFIFSYYFYQRRKETCYLWAIFFFYALMETLQTFQFRTLNQCNNNENKILAFIALIFVVVQPFLWNWYGWRCRSQTKLQKTIFTLGMILGLIWIVVYLLGYNANISEETGAIQGPLCTRKIDKPGHHLYWTFPISNNYIAILFAVYLMIWFIPMFFGKNGVTSGTYMVLTCALSYYFISKNSKEFASTWCLTSIPILAMGATLL